MTPIKLSKIFKLAALSASLIAVGATSAQAADSGQIVTSSAYVTQSQPATSMRNWGTDIPAISENYSYLMKRALINYNEGDYNTASRQLHKILRGQETNPVAHYYMGLTKQKMGNHRKAIKHLSYANRVFRYAPQSYAALGQAYAKAGNMEKAERVILTLNGLRQDCGEHCASAEDVATAKAVIRQAMKG